MPLKIEIISFRRRDYMPSGMFGLAQVAGGPRILDELNEFFESKIEEKVDVVQTKQTYLE